MEIFKKLSQLGEKIETKIKEKLSHYPILYAFIGGVGVIFFWRGVWHSIDYVMSFSAVSGTISDQVVATSQWWDAPLSILIGALLLLPTGLFISSFIGSEIAISGLRGEKKVAAHTEKEMELEVEESSKIEQEIHKIDSHMKYIEDMLAKRADKTK